MSESSTEVIRYIGIVPRVKKTAKDEARPTLLWIIVGDKVINHELDDEQAELDFVYGIMPVKFRAVVAGEDISSFKKHHVKYRDVEEGEDVSAWPEGQIVKNRAGKVIEVPSKVPSHYDGLKGGDIVSMSLGGSGDNFAFALSRMGQTVEATVLRLPPFILKHERGEGDKKLDAHLLARFVKEKPELFYPVYVRDRSIVKVRETLRVRMDAMKARIACGQRLRQRTLGEIFCSEEGKYPEGGIEKYYDGLKTNDPIFTALSAEEGKADRSLLKAVEATEVFQKVLNPVEGLGPAIGSRIISAVMDIRRFEKDSQLKKFMGVHVQPGNEAHPTGIFPRRRNGEIANWHPDSRQAVYLLVDQFIKNKGSEWGQYFLLCKERLQAKHPVIVIVDGKKRYTKGHIHKMAIWRCATRFVEWLFTAWWKMERELAKGRDQKVA